MDARIAVLASGAGTNLQTLLDDPVVGPEIVVAVSDRAGSGAIARAQARGVATEIVEAADGTGRAEYGARLLDVLGRHGVNHVALAGFMRILDGSVVRAFEGRILNVHPSLLPAFPGAYAIRDALEWGASVTGVTVHLVDEEVDHGPIILQEAVPVLEGDDEQTLLQRVHAVEHRLYPRAVRLLIEGRLKLKGRQVRILGEQL